MDERALFEFARENGWHRILRLMKTTHSLSQIARIMNKTNISIFIDCRVMCATGLLRLVEKENGKYAYEATPLGIKFMETYK